VPERIEDQAFEPQPRDRAPVAAAALPTCSRTGEIMVPT
jgi:hypothetical protein